MRQNCCHTFNSWWLNETNLITVRFTGLDNLAKNFEKYPQIVEPIVQKALKSSIAMAETEAKRRTPVLTGLLRSSIGGEQGYSFIRGLTAGVGTNVRYAIFVEMSDRAHHKIGESHFMEKGVKAARSYIQQQFEIAMRELSIALTKTV